MKHYFKKIALNCVTQYLVAVLVYMNDIKTIFSDLHETLLITLFVLDLTSLRFFNFYTKSKTEKQITSQSLRVDRTNKGMGQILEEKYHFI